MLGLIPLAKPAVGNVCDSPTQSGNCTTKLLTVSIAWLLEVSVSLESEPTPTPLLWCRELRAPVSLCCTFLSFFVVDLFIYL